MTTFLKKFIWTQTNFYVANTLHISEDDNQINLNDDDIAKLNYVEIDGNWGTLNLIASVYSKIYSKEEWAPSLLICHAP